MAGHARSALAVVAFVRHQRGHHFTGHQTLVPGQFIDYIKGFGDIGWRVDDDGDNGDMTGLGRSSLSPWGW